MCEGGQQDVEIFPRPFRAAGKVDDQCPAPDTDERARDHRMRGNEHALTPHGLRHPWNLPLDDLSGGIGGDISGAHAGASRRHDEVGFVCFAPFDQSRADHLLFVGDDSPGDDLHSHCLEQTGDLRTAPVLPLAA